ncbi:MAG: hypothetical protein H7Y06_06035 [Opitutaceae bacterium]|nr:hypothetical protein [Opitutaceae bacterium]
MRLSYRDQNRSRPTLNVMEKPTQPLTIAAPSTINAPMNATASKPLAYSAEDAAAVQKVPISTEDLDRALRHMIAHHPAEVLRRVIESLRARARTNCATSALLLRSYMVPTSKPEAKNSRTRADAVGVRAVKYFRRCVTAVKSEIAYISNAELRDEINALPNRPALDFEGWWHAVENLHCLAFLGRLPSTENRLADVYASLELDDQLTPLSTGWVDGGYNTPGGRIKSQLRTFAKRHWKVKRAAPKS